MSGQADRIVFVDDEEDVRRANRQSLELDGFAVEVFPAAEPALRAILADPPGVVVTDVRLPGLDGLGLFRAVAEADPDLPVILITGHGDITMAVRAMREGAYDFLAKPYPAEQLIGSVRRALERRRLVVENRSLRERLDAAVAEDPAFLGVSPEITRLRRFVRDVAEADVDVLILGETGSGKEVVANALHRWSRRRRGNFVAMNCGALPDSVVESELFGHEAGAFTGAVKRRVGRIEHASGGTLFLDEIESMPLALQVKLLRVIQERAVEPLGTNEVRPVDMRIVAATKIDLGQAARPGHLPGRPLLPAQRRHGGDPAAARAPRGRGAALRAFLHPGRRPDQPRSAAGDAGDPRRAQPAFLARQRARAQPFRGALRPRPRTRGAGGAQRRETAHAGRGGRSLRAGPDPGRADHGGRRRAARRRGARHAAQDPLRQARPPRARSERLPLMHEPTTGRTDPGNDPASG
nr:sigma-54 dependent transcriptional regulator [Methylobacterium nodulans]